MSLVLLLLFGLEAWLVQSRTLLAPQAQARLEPLIDQALRFGFDLLAGCALIGLLPRPVVAGVFAAQVVFYAVILLHHQRFRQPLSLRSVLATPGRGILPETRLAQLFHPWQLLFVASLGLKLLFLDALPDNAFPLQTGLVSLLAYGLLLSVVNRRYRPLREIATWQTLGGLGVVFGYLPAWAAEVAYRPPEDALARALSATRPDTDELTPIETPAPVANCLVFLQLERLDWAIVDFRIRQQEVTPNLNRLVRRGMAYAVRPEGCTGSSEADFIMLTGKLPSTEVPVYRIDGYPGAASLVARMTAMGFGTTVIHGASGEMYNRRSAFERMGFERLLFREEFQDMGPAPLTGWSIPDDDLLQFAAMDFSARAGRQFQLVITSTSVPPFPNYDPALARFFAASTSVAERYFDVTHYVDWAVGRFLESLPAETTVVLYGSRESEVELGAVGYTRSRHDPPGLVPFVVLETGRDLSGLQRTTDVARTGRFTLQDAARWIHASLELQQAESGVARPG